MQFRPFIFLQRFINLLTGVFLSGRDAVASLFTICIVQTDLTSDNLGIIVAP